MDPDQLDDDLVDKLELLVTHYYLCMSKWGCGFWYYFMKTVGHLVHIGTLEEVLICS